MGFGNYSSESTDHCLHICYLISSFRPVIGGAERATERLSSELYNNGLDVVVITRRQSTEVSCFEKINGVPVYRLGASNKVGALVFALHSLWILTTRLRAYRILHVQNLDTPLLVGFIAKTFLGRKLVATIHGEVPLYERSRNFLGRLRLRLMCRMVDYFTAISPENEKQIQALGVPLSRIKIIPNGIDTNTFCPPDALQRSEARTHLNISTADRVVLYLGRLADWKRVDLLLEAWVRLNHLENDRLLVAGAGSEYSRLKKQAEELNIRVRFEGPTDDAISYLHAADIFVLPSGVRSTATYEGLSVALIEAMSTGLAIIATDCPGNRALIKNDHSGLLFSAESADELTKCLKSLLDASALRHRLGQNARASSVERYSISVVAQKTRAIYDQLK